MLRIASTYYAATESQPYRLWTNAAACCSFSADRLVLPSEWTVTSQNKSEQRLVSFLFIYLFFFLGVIVAQKCFCKLTPFVSVRLCLASHWLAERAPITVLQPYVKQIPATECWDVGLCVLKSTFEDALCCTVYWQVHFSESFSIIFFFNSKTGSRIRISQTLF